MTAIVICSTILLALIIFAVACDVTERRKLSYERENARAHHNHAKEEREFWADRDLDKMKRDLAEALAQAQEARNTAQTALNHVHEYERGQAMRGR